MLLGSMLQPTWAALVALAAGAQQTPVAHLSIGGLQMVRYNRKETMSPCCDLITRRL